MSEYQYDIICIDDETFMTTMFTNVMELIFEEIGTSLKIKTYNSTDEALRDVNEKNLSAKVWLLDIMMQKGQINGVEMAEKLRRAFPGRKDMYIYAFTALNPNVIMERYTTGGVFNGAYNKSQHPIDATLRAIVTNHFSEYIPQDNEVIDELPDFDDYVFTRKIDASVSEEAAPKKTFTIGAKESSSDELEFEDGDDEDAFGRDPLEEARSMKDDKPDEDLDTFFNNVKSMYENDEAESTDEEDYFSSDENAATPAKSEQPKVIKPKPEPVKSQPEPAAQPKPAARPAQAQPSAQKPTAATGKPVRPAGTPQAKPSAQAPAGQRPVSRPKPAAQNAGEPAVKPATKPAPAQKPASKPVPQTPAKPAAKPASATQTGQPQKPAVKKPAQPQQTGEKSMAVPVKKFQIGGGSTAAKPATGQRPAKPSTQRPAQPINKKPASAVVPAVKKQDEIGAFAIEGIDNQKDEEFVLDFEIEESPSSKPVTQGGDDDWSFTIDDTPAEKTPYRPAISPIAGASPTSRPRIQQVKPADEDEVMKTPDEEPDALEVSSKANTGIKPGYIAIPKWFFYTSIAYMIIMFLALVGLVAYIFFLPS